MWDARRVRLSRLVALTALAAPAWTLVACGSSSPGGGSGDGGAGDGDGASDDALVEPCTTRIEYGSRWIKPASHPEQFDIVDGDVTWDGSCTIDGNNSYATLSNGFKPYFTSKSGCEIAIDPSPTCASASPICKTRITYAETWAHPANHPEQYDDVAGKVFWNRTCEAAGENSRATLSNGWQPYFDGASSCGIALRWTGCGGLYNNAVMNNGCADPGVVFDGTQYVMSCTSGNAANAFPIYVSTDLVHWTAKGHILPTAAKPTWAVSDFWAPEIHKIGTQWVAYWSARQSNGKLAIGAAYASDPLGPYTALTAPLIANAGVGLIDANSFYGGTTPYLVWKEDGNAIGNPTPIKARALAPNGLAFANATTTTLITNDKTWEGALVEAPFIIEHKGEYFLFYSGNAYYDDRYAVGIARASSPTGPYTKAANPIVVTKGQWVGPGHNSIVDGHDGDMYMVYHAWKTGMVNGPGDKRYPLVDQIQWQADGWPAVYGAPSSVSRPLP